MDNITTEIVANLRICGVVRSGFLRSRSGSIGALLRQLMVALLRKNGVDVAKVRFVNIGASVAVFRATVMATVDAGTGELAIIDQQDRYMALELPGYTYQGAWTSGEVIARKRDALVTTMAAYARLYRFVQSPDARDAFLAARKTLFPNRNEADCLGDGAVTTPVGIVTAGAFRADTLQNGRPKAVRSSRVWCQSGEGFSTCRRFWPRWAFDSHPATAQMTGVASIEAYPSIP